MLDVSGPEVYSGIINVSKQLKNFDFQETVQSFRFVGLNSFHGFVILEGRMESIACLVFYLIIKI